MSSSTSRPHTTTTTRRRTAASLLGGAIAVCALSASPAAAQGRGPSLLDRPTAPGPAAQIAWTSGTRILVSAPGAPARTVAVMPRRDTNLDIALSRDGRFLVANGAKDAYLVRIADGGRPVRVGANVGGGATRIRWAPDNRQVALLDGGAPRLCVVAPTVSCRRATTGAAIDEYGASWSPDSTRLAFVRESGRSADQTGDLVTVDHVRGDDLRVIERARRTKLTRTYPTPPVWTRAGLAFSSFTAATDDDAGVVLRVRTRIVQPDGRVHTLTAAAGVDGTRFLLPFLAGSDSPSGLLVGTTIDGRADDPTDELDYRVGLRTLDLQGSLQPYGVDYRATDRRFAEPVGILADGRVALVASEDGKPNSSLYLVAPGTSGLGKPVATGASVDAAVAYPDEARGF